MWWLMLVAFAAAAANDCAQFAEKKQVEGKDDPRLAYLNFFGFTKNAINCAQRAQFLKLQVGPADCKDRRFLTDYILYDPLRHTCWLAHPEKTMNVVGTECKPILPSFKMTLGPPRGQLINAKHCREGGIDDGRKVAKIGKSSGVAELSINWDIDCSKALNLTCCASYCNGYAAAPAADEASDEASGNIMSVMLGRDVPLDTKAGRELGGGDNKLATCQMVLHAFNHVIDPVTKELGTSDGDKIKKDHLFKPFRFLALQGEGKNVYCSIFKPEGLAKSSVEPRSANAQCWALEKAGLIVPKKGATFMSSSYCAGENKPSGGGIFTEAEVKALPNEPEGKVAPLCRASKDCELGEWQAWPEKRLCPGDEIIQQRRNRTIIREHEAGGKPCPAKDRVDYRPCLVRCPHVQFCERFPNPCLYGGVCESDDKERGFTCQCKEGHTGKYCQDAPCEEAPKDI